MHAANVGAAHPRPRTMAVTSSSGVTADKVYAMVVNPIACAAHGVCAELFPERISLDEWGYPIIDPRPVPTHLLDHARRAVAACPTLALVLSKHPKPAQPAPLTSSRRRRPT